jgi:hypothetical protein
LRLAALTNASRKVGRDAAIVRRTAAHTAQTKFFIASAGGIRAAQHRGVCGSISEFVRP